MVDNGSLLMEVLPAVKIFDMLQAPIIYLKELCLLASCPCINLLFIKEQALFCLVYLCLLPTDPLLRSSFN